MLAYSTLALDRAASARSYDADGRLHIAPHQILTEASISEYAGREVPEFERLGLNPDKIYRLWRHPDELRAAAKTFNNLPILNKHIPVSADEHRPDLVIGSTGTDAVFQKPYLRNSLVIWARDAIEDIAAGRRKGLSCGYHYRARIVAGKTPSGEEYSGIMTSIRGNHLAVVIEPRVGAAVVADSADELQWHILAGALAKFARL